MHYGNTISVTNLCCILKLALGLLCFYSVVESQRGHLHMDPPRNKTTALYRWASRRGSSRAQAVTTMTETASQHGTASRHGTAAFVVPLALGFI